jgi:hypothetical protein
MAYQEKLRRVVTDPLVVRAAANLLLRSALSYTRLDLLLHLMDRVSQIAG